MLHPIFSVAIKRPDLLVDHISAYGALVREEASSIVIELLIRCIAWAVALMAGLIFLVLAGVAIMLGVFNNEFHWILIIVPGAAFIVSIIAIFLAKKPFLNEFFPQFKVQIGKDVQALRTAK